VGDRHLKFHETRDNLVPLSSHRQAVGHPVATWSILRHLIASTASNHLAVVPAGGLCFGRRIAARRSPGGTGRWTVPV